ncbi:MAG TPA: flagellar basal body-associated FliL family protein [Candidatus Limnocylindria bacterium]|jgi:flagellar FliL protein|nr:flagellar basal body-associated FliL family protein [Candidatus Limnocylindria bacterium]
MKEAPSANAAAAAEVPAAAASGGGFKAWLPLLANLILMPAIAYGVAVYVLLPKLNSTAPAAGAVAEEHAEAKEGGEHGAKPGAEKKEGKGAELVGGKIAVPLGNKVLVNVSGTMGTRYLMVSITLVGTEPGLKDEVEKHDAQLRDAAASTLASKTIIDLEKPGARNMIRTELVAAFNSVLGGNTVSEIYLPEFAIQ